jgi:hypothetical protein
MTVRELIEQLQTIDPDVHVFTSGYEGGFDDAGPISSTVDMALDYYTKWYYGKHEIVENCHPLIENKIVKGIVL